MWPWIGIKLVYKHFDHDHVTKQSKVYMSYFENKPLFMSFKVRFSDIVIVYFYDILIDQSLPWLNQVT